MLEGKTDIPTHLWIAPPTKMDAMILNEEGSRHPRQVRCAHGNARLQSVHGQPGTDQEGQHSDFDLDAQIPNRLGIDTRVYLSSAELAAVTALMGRIPTMAEYLEQVQAVNAKAADV